MTLELLNVTKKVKAESHIFETSLSFNRGGFNILLGATNSGKTTLIKLMAGLERPTSGEIRFDGQNVIGISPQKRNIALVHQFFINYPHMTVYENIASPLRVAGIETKELDRRVRDSAEVLQLGELLDRRPQELSGGQQQRTAIARAIVKDTTAVFFDEPLANLDYKLREELRDQLPEILAERGSIVVYATSDPTEALLLGGHTALVHEGRLTQFGKTAAIYNSPANLISARVFSDPPINLGEVEKRGDKIHFGSISWDSTGEVKSLSDGSYTMAIRPHHVPPTPPSEHSIPVKDRVKITELSGSESVAYFSLGDQDWVSLSAGTHPFRIGEEHEFHLIPEKCFYFGPDGTLVAKGSSNG